MRHLTLLLIFGLFPLIWCKKYEGDDKPDWAKKNIRDYTDADIERLYDQWEVSEIYYYNLLFNNNLLKYY